MAEVKISELTSATTPLAGTETVPIVQGGVTKKVAVSNFGGSLPSMIETNATDLTLWNNGKGNIASNTSFGDGALKSNTSGSNNTIIGVNASDASTTAQSNVAIGSEALGAVTTGSFNVAIGANANSSTTTASSNVAIGNNANRYCTTGSGNIMIGQSAGVTNVSGIRNVCIGGDVLDGNENDCVALGASTSVNGAASIAIGSSSTAANGAIAIGTAVFAVNPNEIAIGSSLFPAGTVASQVNTSSKYWQVTINGTVQKILLA